MGRRFPKQFPDRHIPQSALCRGISPLVCSYHGILPRSDNCSDGHSVVSFCHLSVIGFCYVGGKRERKLLSHWHSLWQFQLNAFSLNCKQPCRPLLSPSQAPPLTSKTGNPAFSGLPKTGFPVMLLYELYLIQTPAASKLLPVKSLSAWTEPRLYCP